MKCWTRYVLPLVIALCVFLGSSFCSFAAEETDAVQGVTPEGLGYESLFLNCKDEVQAVLDGRDFNLDDMYYYGYYDSATDRIMVYVTLSQFTCDELGDGYFYDTVRYFTRYTFIITADGDFVSGSYYYYTMNSKLAIPLNSTCFSGYDVLDTSGNVVFQGPSSFRQVVQRQDWTTVMMEIVMILPCLIVFLVSLIGLRKGLRYILNLLRRA